MIPKVCVNCGVGANVVNDQQVLGHVCDAMPFTLWIDDPLTHRCGGFRMSDAPIYVVPDEQQAVEDAEDGEPRNGDGGTEQGAE